MDFGVFGAVTRGLPSSSGLKRGLPGVAMGSTTSTLDTISGAILPTTVMSLCRSSPRSSAPFSSTFFHPVHRSRLEMSALSLVPTQMVRSPPSLPCPLLGMRRPLVLQGVWAVFPSPAPVLTKAPPRVSVEANLPAPVAPRAIAHEFLPENPGWMAAVASAQMHAHRALAIHLWDAMASWPGPPAPQKRCGSASSLTPCWSH